MSCPLEYVRHPVLRHSLRVVAAAVTLTATSAIAHAQPTTTAADGGPSWSAVQQALGGRGAMQAGDVLKFSFPRSDLQVIAAGVVLKPALALGSWVAFKRMGNGARADVMVMGDLVLLEEEVAPVMAALQSGGVEQSALHNHVLRESPRVMYMHIMAHGDAAKIASTIRTAIAASKTPVAAGPAPAPASAAIDLDTAGIARVLGHAGRVNGGVYQVSIARGERIMDHGMAVPPSMGLATAINFQPTGNGKAAITGDFVMTAGEVNRVIRALRANGIEVAALHGHMLTETPRLFFMHFWANDDAMKLARGLRAALEQTNSVKSVGRR